MKIKFNIDKASDWKYKDQIEIETLEELMKFIEDNGSVVIRIYDNRNDITICDGYIE